MVACSTDSDYTWELVKGDDSTRVFEYRDPDDNPIDLTGASAVCLVDIGTEDETIAATIGEAEGTITVTLTHTLTATLAGAGEFRIKLTMSGGEVKTLVIGTIVIRP